MRWGLGALAALATLSGGHAADSQSSDDAARYAGYYFAEPSEVARLEARDGALVAHAAGLPDTTFVPEGPGKFFASATQTHLVFQTNPDGQVTGAIITQGSGPPIAARRVTEVEARRLADAAIDHTLVAYASTNDSAHLPDGRTIHMVCMGKGSPVVVLTAGAGGWSSAWHKVQPAVAEKTRVCAWDRAGWGMSSPSPLPQTADNRTSDLQAALKADGIAGPYVVVGHSLGGYESLLLKDREPSKVVGMVLVDPSFPGQIAAWRRVAPAMMELASQPSAAVAYFHKCAVELRSGTVKIGSGPDPQNCGHPPYGPTLPPELRAALEKAQVTAGPETLAGVFDTLAYYSFPELLEVDSQITLNPRRNYGNMPLVVLTAGVMEAAPNSPEAVKAENPLVKAEWLRAHDALASLSERGVNRVVPDTTHNIQELRPQAVIEAINEVVDRARASKH